MADPFERLAGESFCYVTTTGRRTGRPHTIEIWFAHRDGALYLLAEGRERADWVRNLMRLADARVRVGGDDIAVRARIVTDAAEDRAARELLAAKYQDWRPGTAMSEWARTALPVALEPVSP